MAVKTVAQLKAAAAVIRDETAIGANTKLRVYNMYIDVIDSLVSLTDQLQLTTDATGTNTYAIASAITSYSDDFTVFVKFINASSGVSTLNANSLGAKKIFKDATTQATTGDLTANKIYILVYDATLDSASGGFLIVGSSGGDGSGTVESVTGDGVDNTDPDNPVISFPTPGDIGAEATGVAAGLVAAAIVDSIADSDTTHAPSRNAVFDALATKQASLGYTAENSANKSTDVNTDQASNTKYPSVKAVYDWAVGLFQTLTAKDATGGYAGLTLFKINFKNAANTFTSFFTNSNTAARTYTFPDRDLSFTIDGTLAGNSDSNIPSEKAVKTYVDANSSPDDDFLHVASFKSLYNY